MPRQRPGERRCVCGHDKTLHAWPERRSDGLGACSGFIDKATLQQGCACARFVTPGQRRYSERQKRHAEAVREARDGYARIWARLDGHDARELARAQARKDSQEG
jgi:hypothetical protein